MQSICHVLWVCHCRTCHFWCGTSVRDTVAQPGVAIYSPALLESLSVSSVYDWERIVCHLLRRSLEVLSCYVLVCGCCCCWNHSMHPNKTESSWATIRYEVPNPNYGTQLVFQCPQSAPVSLNLTGLVCGVDNFVTESVPAGVFTYVYEVILWIWAPACCRG